VQPSEEEARATAHTATGRQRVLDTLQRIAPNVALAELNPGAPLRDQVDLDSMDWLNFVAALQEAFGIDIPEMDHPQLATLDSIVSYLASRHPISPGRRTPASREYRLADGTTVTIRPIRADDANRVRDFLEASSGESRYRRFQKWIEAPSSALVHFLTDLSPRGGVAIVASVPTASGEEIIAEARCMAGGDGNSCELGLLVQDAWQKTGVAGLLMEALIEAARDRGYATIDGLVLKSNAPMLQFARSFGFSIEPQERDRTTLYIRRRIEASPAADPAAPAKESPFVETRR
jgi:acyl carrier protein